MNPRNHGIVTGRLVSAPRVFANSDGSRTALITVAARDNYTGRDGERDTQYVNLEGFIPANRSRSAFDMVTKGSLVTVVYSVRSDRYTDKSGDTVYKQALHVETMELLESKSVTDRRRTGQTQAQAQAPQWSQPQMANPFATNNQAFAPSEDVVIVD